MILDIGGAIDAAVHCAHLHFVYDTKWAFLEGSGRILANSQNGEDGIILALLRHIGETNRWCFEFGAGDGTKLSNTKVLRDAGWSAGLIDAVPYPGYRECENERVKFAIETITPENVDATLKSLGVPRCPDFGSIDVDGQDWHIWRAMKIRPRIVCIEYARGDRSEPPPPLGGDGQAGIDAIISLGRHKEYDPVAVTNVNVIFVAREAVPRGR